MALWFRQSVGRSFFSRLMMVDRLIPVRRAIPRWETRSRCNFSANAALAARSRAASSVVVWTPQALQWYFCRPAAVRPFFLTLVLPHFLQRTVCIMLTWFKGQQQYVLYYYLFYLPNRPQLLVEQRHQLAGSRALTAGNQC